MDVDSLKNELEEHLKRNPDEHAPSGFRDRFAATLEDIEAAGSDEEKKELEAELQRIRTEAECAANCACGDSGDAASEADEAKGEDRAAEAPAAATAAEAPRDEPMAEEPAPAASAAEPSPPPASAGPRPAAAPAEAANDSAGEPAAGLMQRYGLILALVLIALVVVIYFYR